MSDLRELYQSVILDHNRRPRNRGPLEAATHHAAGHNPLCGDALEVHARLDADGRVAAVSFEGQGCAISTASASLMTDALSGRTREEAEAMFEAFHALVTTGASDADEDVLGKLRVFAGVSEFPVRVKCATLCWHTARAAWRGSDDPVTTE